MVVQYLVEAEDGRLYTVYDIKEATHVILDIEDYAELSEAYESGGVDRLIADAKGAATGGAPQSADVSDGKRIQELELALQSARNLVKYERSMNEGFRRIFKERANAARKLKSKKEHSGYVIQVSAEKEKFGLVNKQRRTIWVMETVLQTPYDDRFNMGQVKIETLELTRAQPDGSRLVDVIGLGAMYNSAAVNVGLSAVLNEMVTLSKEKFQQARKENLILFRQFKFNAKSGYWEVTLTHMAPLSCYHATMMPSKPKTVAEAKKETEKEVKNHKTR